MAGALFKVEQGAITNADQPGHRVDNESAASIVKQLIGNDVTDIGVGGLGAAYRCPAVGVFRDCRIAKRYCGWRFIGVGDGDCEGRGRDATQAVGRLNLDVVDAIGVSVQR